MMISLSSHVHPSLSIGCTYIIFHKEEHEYELNPSKAKLENKDSFISMYISNEDKTGILENDVE